MQDLKDIKTTYSITRRKLVLVNLMTPTMRELRSLLSENHPLIDVDTEEEAIQLIDKQHDNISAILFNLEICKKSNFTLQKQLDADKRFVGIPNIAITETPGTADYLDCLNAGVNEYIEPPFRKELILLRINNAIKSKDSATFSEVERMLRELPSNIYLKDIEGRYVFATHYWHHLHTENDPTWTIRGKTNIEIREDKENARKAMQTDLDIIKNDKGTNYIIQEKGENGTEFLELIKRPTHDENGNVNGIVAIINNVTEMQTLKLELEKRSKTDQLTGLLNKQATEEIIKNIIRQDIDHNVKGVLLMADTDKFKEINDNFGHLAGDRVLKAIGKLLHDSIKGMDVAGRIGGDEFIVYLRDVDDIDTALRLAARISDRARHLFDGENLEKHTSLSIGLAMFPEHGREFEDLYRAADKALYYVKEHGRDFYKMYSPKLKSIITN